MTTDELEQLRTIIREEIKPLGENISVAETRLSEKIETLDMKTEVQFRALDKKIDEKSEQIIDILTNTVDEILKMQDQRISPIEEHLGLKEPHRN